MSEHPPPAPDWILGEDGHWKPPPFTTGGRPPAPPAPAPPGIPPDPPAGAGAPPPGGAPGWTPPPATGPSPGRIVAWVVGGLAVAGVAVVGVLITAVTFLGTSARSEARFTPVGTGPIDRDDRPVTTAPAGSATGEEATPDEEVPVVISGSQIATVAIAEALGDGWVPTGGEALAVDDIAGSCAPEGWLTGALDRFRSYYDRPGGPVTDALTLSLTAYTDAGAAQAEHERARSQANQDCELIQHRAEFGADATITTLPDDPLAPGVAFQVDEVDGARTEYDLTVIVGEVRAHLDFCGCADLGIDDQRGIARQVAAALATEQGLPVPG